MINRERMKEIKGEQKKERKRNTAILPLFLMCRDI
jgi:hypothetical protein